MGESVENCLNLDGVDRLISLPKGCAEQTMVTMSPAIHAMRYLDATGQWVDLKAERRDEAQAMIQAGEGTLGELKLIPFETSTLVGIKWLKFIDSFSFQGYGRILTFKKTDGSYGAFLSTPSSVWLTAFIAKELSQCRDVISVEDSYIQQSISYLVSKQLASGAFTDPNPLYDRTMQVRILYSSVRKCVFCCTQPLQYRHTYTKTLEQWAAIVRRMVSSLWVKCLAQGHSGRFFT